MIIKSRAVSILYPVGWKVIMLLYTFNRKIAAIFVEAIHTVLSRKNRQAQ